MEGGRTDKSTFPLTPPGIHHYAFEAGHVLGGRFELLEPLGYGGVGEVYRALDRSLHEEVALKVVFNASLCAVYLDRVRREVTVARNLSHPNILKYFDLHEFPDGPALSMELVHGRTLQQKLDDEGPLSEDAVRSFLVQIVEALGHLHQNGLIHRDIKPSNIFITDDGIVKIGDFGIVHVESAEGLTLTGESLGTPTYMSPEQIQGKPLTAASDFYSLGVTLHEIVSGKVPFEGTYGEVASAHLSKPPPTLADLPLSGRLKRLILGLLEKNPTRRWRGEEIRRFLARSRLPLLPRQRRWAWLGVAIGILAAGAILLAPRALARTEPTEVVTEGRIVTCLHEGRVLWKKEFDRPVDGHVLLDVDQDGEREVILITPQTLKGDHRPLSIPSWEGTGEPGPPLHLNAGHMLDTFGAFSPEYRVVCKKQNLFSDGQEDLVLFLRHEIFFPFYLSIWSTEQRREVISFEHPGWISQVRRWKDGLAIHGGNARLLHLAVLALTGPIRQHVTAEGLSVSGSQPTSDQFRAYYLLENLNVGGAVAEMSAESPISVTLSDGPHALLEDGRLEGMKAGASNGSVICLSSFAQVREHFRGGRFKEAEGLIRETLSTARKYGLIGWVVVMEWLEAERLARMGEVEAAATRCYLLLTEYPAHAQELPVWAGYYRYLANDFAGARKAWLENPSAGLVGGGKQWELYPAVIFAGLLEGEGEEILLAMITEFAAGMAPEYHWNRFLNMQKGWIPLLRGDPAAAVTMLKPALKEVSFEPHAAGYFLACILNGTYDPAEMAAYAGKVGGNPLYLQWVAALGSGDQDKARQLWKAVERDAWESQDTALMVPVLKHLQTRLPNK